MSNDRTLIIAHRGASGEAPENTLAAFSLALAQGCDAIELDIHLSADGDIVVCHDDTLQRTTDRNGKIHEWTTDELKWADAGKKFHEKYEGEQIPLLEEVFDLVPPEIMINVEIKGSNGRRTEAKLVELVRRRNRIDSVIVSSFDHKGLALLKQLEPSIRIGLLYTGNFMSHTKIAENAGIPVYSLHPYYKHLDAVDIREAIRSGLHVYPYTINNEQEMKKAINLGVSGIITDYPARLRRLLESDMSTILEQ
ncbi:Glycerophosphoryl diester phosphodiesterase [compost metagenome]